ncbi:hypothetical protein MNBD_GAMMA24-9 [hydrothermal vent metagenome]|uniref:Uncharacterized protein n=1 Tax=hydrothermal vent metagenome TaxID=652676 RepID=A0A3B1CBR5_9ZZZZ
MVISWILIVMALISSFTVMAESSSGVGVDYKPSQFKLNVVSDYSVNRQVPLHLQLTHDEVGGRWNVSKDLLQPHFPSLTRQDNLAAEATGLQQYDAALSLFPMMKKGMNLDLGLNIRFIDGNAVFAENGQQQFRNFRAAIPMFYAAALFNLPFKGLSAGFVGRHSNSMSNPSFDYKAKLSYEWIGGLGLEGGWQRQQYANDELNQLQRKPVAKGLFLDLHLKF